MENDKQREGFDKWYIKDCPSYINEGDAGDIWQAAQAAQQHEIDRLNAENEQLKGE